MTAEVQHHSLASEGWARLEPQLAATRARGEMMSAYETEGAHSLVPYGIDRFSPGVDLDGRRYLMMSGYSYLGLSGDERVVAAAKAAIDRYGTGTHGVRVLAGSLPLHTELESSVARAAGRPDALVFGSGYAANAGTISAILGPRDTVFVDKADHASILDGCRISRATTVRFRHNDADDLDRRLRTLAGDGVRLVVVDSVYSMDGDIAPLPALREVCDRHGALLMVDEAHAFGVIGPRGGGIEDHFGHRAFVDIKMGTLSKAIPSVGGWVAGPVPLIQHLRYNARPFLFSAALPPGQIGAAIEALRILEAEPERVAHTQAQAARLRAALNDAGISTGRSESAVVPLIAGADDRACDLASACRRQGVIALPVLPPAVARGTARLRLAVTARHSADDIDIAITAFLTASRACGLLP
jgi:8-amino-7-oxononanoate synthase